MRTRVPERERVLFGRRKGKTLRSYHASLVEELLPQLQLDVSKPVNPALLFPGSVGALQLEIGFGGGEHLAAAALANPDIGYIGCEPFLNGVAKILADIDQHNLHNIRLHAGDAGEVIDRLPDAALARVDLLYPDPWPKRRQQKRRFVSDAMLTRLARVMQPGAALRFATDIDDYAGWTLARIMHSDDFIWQAGTSSDWTLPWADWVSTRYEAKALREGRPPVYLTFVRK